jgi:magnesium chelatase family protein
MDRVDLRVQMLAPPTGAFSAAARRWREHGWRTNAEVPGHVLRKHFPLSRDALAAVESAMRDGRMSARGAERTIRVAWTICDLRGSASPSVNDVRSALNFRDRGQR